MTRSPRHPPSRGRSSRPEGWTSVSRVFTDPARTPSPHALYGRRSHRMVFPGPRHRRLELRGRCALHPLPVPGSRGDRRTRGGGGPFASVPRTETSPGLKGQIRFLPLDSTSLVWKSSEEVVIFSKGIWFRACVIKPESTCFSPRSSIPAFFPPPTPIFFLFNCHPSFWTQDRTCLDGRSNLFCACCTRLCSGYSESHSFPNFNRIPKL